MNILAIETSCDETAISALEAGGDFDSAHFSLLSNVVHSQIEEHKEYGGVFPTVAKREHTQNLVPVLMQALEQGFGISNSELRITNKLTDETINKLRGILEREPKLLEKMLAGVPQENPGVDAIAVTHGPGLEPALWVGINFAKALALIWNVPIVPINHMEGHIFSAFMPEGASISNSQFLISKVQFPALALLVSGGHTELVLTKNWLEYEKIGQTRDDAAGEAFDKVARLLDLGYPGGPEISRLAESSSGSEQYKLPRPMLDSGNYDFSFSGLKTAVLYMVRDIKNLDDKTRADIAYEFQEAVVDVLARKTIAAAREYGAKTFLLGGGVAANARLREELGIQIKNQLPHTIHKIPDTTYTGDNAAMIAVAGYYRYKNGDTKPAEEISANSNLSL